RQVPDRAGNMKAHDRVNVMATPGVKCLLRKLHQVGGRGLLRHRLLLQPHGSEGVACVVIAATPRLAAQAHDLHVLLRHRLLLQAQGFEGQRRVPESPEAENLAFPELENPPSGGLALYSAALASIMDPANEQRDIAYTERLIDLRLCDF